MRNSATHLDERFVAFTETVEQTTRLTIAGWRQRLDVLAEFFPDGIEQGPALVDEAMQLDALYWMADALSRHGFPGRSLPVFGQHVELCRKMGSQHAPRLAAALSQQAVALRHCGRLHDADLLAREGLDLQRRVGESFSLGLNLFAFAQGLVERGEQDESRRAFDEAVVLLNQAASTDVERALAATLIGSRASGDFLRAEQLVEQLAQSEIDMTADGDAVGLRQVRVMALRLKGEQHLALAEFEPAQEVLRFALRLADEIAATDEVLRMLSALTAVCLATDNRVEARRWITAAFPLLYQGPYRLLDADAHHRLAALERRGGQLGVAELATERASLLAICDGAPFSYVPSPT
jgi:tetratricopeptide (TPR) repeat protein